MQAGLCGCLKKAVHGAVHLHELLRKSAEASHDEIGDAAGEEELGQEALLPMPAVRRMTYFTLFSSMEGHLSRSRDMTPFPRWHSMISAWSRSEIRE